MTIYHRAQRADRLVRVGMSRRAACKRVGISTDTLARYQAGKLETRYGRVRGVVEMWRTKGGPSRCCICGRKVYQPCMACQLEEARA